MSFLASFVSFNDFIQAFEHWIKNMRFQAYNSTAISYSVTKWGKNLNRHISKEDMKITNGYVKRCSTPLIIRERQIRTTMRYHFTPIRMAVIKKQRTASIGKDLEKRESFNS